MLGFLVGSPPGSGDGIFCSQSPGLFSRVGGVSSRLPVSACPLGAFRDMPRWAPIVWGVVGRMARLLLSLRVLSRSARHLARRGNIYLLLQQALIVRLGRPTIFTNVM